MNTQLLKTFAAIFFTSCLLLPSALSDEWGDWDDLPDQLLSPSSNNLNAVDALYDQLSRSDNLDEDADQEAITQWLEELDVEFGENEDLSDLLDSLKGESDEDIETALEEWLDLQLEALYDETDEELDAFEDAFEDDLEEEDEEDEEDEFEELDEEEEEEEDDYEEEEEDDS